MDELQKTKQNYSKIVKLTYKYNVVDVCGTIMSNKSDQLSPNGSIDEQCARYSWWRLVLVI